MNEGISCYHEAGHAVALWHYGISLQYVTMRPPAESGHGGQTRTVKRGEITDPVEMESEMRCAAAGEIAQTRVFRLKKVPTDDELMKRFTRYTAIITAHPDRNLPPDDDLTFARMGLARDDEISKTDPKAPIGPARWVRIWREAEHLIRVELWPAVRAVAEELRRSEQDLTDSDVARLAAAAMETGAP